MTVGKHTLRVVEAATRTRKAVVGSTFIVSVLPPRKVLAQPAPSPAPPSPAPAPPDAIPPAPMGPPPGAPTPIACSSLQPQPSSPDQLAISYVVNPLGYVGTDFGTEVWATGGVAPYELTGASPNAEGLFVYGGRLDNAYFGGYFIQGVPRAAGVFHQQLTVTDSAGTTVTADVCLQFAQPLRITTTSLAAGEVGVPYSATLVTQGGFAPVLLSTQSPVSLADGLYAQGSTLRGTPTMPAISSVPVTAVDGANATWTTWLTLTVGPLPAPRTLHVPGDAATIADAIAAASPGDTILVGPGTYRENLDFAGKAIAVRSTDGAAHTTIAGATSAPVVSFTHQEPPAATLDGFTVRGHPEQLSAASPEPTPTGGGVDIEGASPTVEHDVIGPAWAQSGSGVYILGGAATVSHDTIAGNVATQNSFSDGGGLGIWGVTQVTVLDSVVSGNSYGISVAQAQSVSMEGNLIKGNEYAAVYAAALDFRSVDDAIVGNDTRGGWTATNIPEGAVIAPPLGGHATVLNDTIADNGLGVPLDTRLATSVRDTVVEATADLHDMVRCDGTFMAPDYADNVFWHTDWRDRELDAECIRAVPGNRVADPHFQDRTHGNFTPGQGSALIDGSDPTVALPELDQAGHPRVVDGNRDGTAVADVGAYERQ